LAGAIVSAFAIGSGAVNLEFANNYRVFFSDENPELTAFENLQATYTKNDNFLFVLEPSGGDAFSADTLAAVEELTEAAWQIPFAIRLKICFVVRRKWMLPSVTDAATLHWTSLYCETSWLLRTVQLRQ
jgi:hypothetical protein